MLSPASVDARLSLFFCAGYLNSSLSVILLLLCWLNGTLTVLVVYPGVSETPLRDVSVCLANGFGIFLCGVFFDDSFGCGCVFGGAGVDGGDGAGLSGLGGGIGVCFGCAGIAFGLTGVCCSSADSETWCARSSKLRFGPRDVVWDVVLCGRGGSGCTVTLFQWSI